VELEIIIQNSSQAFGMPAKLFDYVIVGAGASGSVLARRLAETGSTVVLLERGPSDEGRDEIADLSRYQEAIAGPCAERLTIVNGEGLNPRAVYPAGRVLGGSTSLNTCVWFRPPSSDFASWRKAGATGWSEEAIDRCFAALESAITIEEVPAVEAPHCAMLAAAAQSGFPLVDFAKTFEEGYAPYRLSKKGTARQSASIVFLRTKPPLSLNVVTESAVKRLIVEEGGKVSAVEAESGTYAARRDVVLSAGAFGTPKLLMLSGIGPAESLKRLGIPVFRDLPGVGRHLLDHPAAAINFAARQSVTRQAVWNYAGVLFARAAASATEWPDVEIQLGPEMFDRFTVPAGYPTGGEGFCAYVTVNRALSEGLVKLSSAVASSPVEIDPNFFGDAKGYDLKAMIEGMRVARRMFAQPALRPWIGTELAPGVSCQNDAGLADFLRSTVTTGYHPAGTCKMGRRDDDEAVVGHDLRVRGFDNLRIADASVFPTMVSVNIAPTCMMVGMRCAELIERKEP
jgi:choline oxidase